MNKLRISLSSVAAVIAFSHAALATPDNEAALMKEAKVTKADAEKTALAKVPNGTIKSEELEKEHGKLVWSFDIAQPNTRSITEILVDANTGKIIATQHENPTQQAAETAADKMDAKVQDKAHKTAAMGKR